MFGSTVGYPSDSLASCILSHAMYCIGQTISSLCKTKTRTGISKLTNNDKELTESSDICNALIIVIFVLLVPPPVDYSLLNQLVILFQKILPKHLYEYNALLSCHSWREVSIKFPTFDVSRWVIMCASDAGGQLKWCQLIVRYRPMFDYCLASRYIHIKMQWANCTHPLHTFPNGNSQ